MILDRILARKAEELVVAKAAISERALRDTPGYESERRGFRAALGGAGRSIIAEIKKASPSAGVIRADFDAARHAREYEGGGARCLSVLTDRDFFQGSLDYLVAARGACRLPLLRKDFTIDRYQITEARAFGADAVLLIVAALEDSALVDLLGIAGEEGLDALVEVHDESELRRALAIGATLVGVNNRNLRTFDTSITVTRTLAGLVPDEVTLVSESGLGHPHQLAQLESVGVDAFLIGEAFMRADDPGAALREFVGGGA